MEKIKVKYVGPYTSTLICKSHVGIIKKGDVIKITERELEELDDNFKKIHPKKAGEIDD